MLRNEPVITEYNEAEVDGTLFEMHLTAAEIERAMPHVLSVQQDHGRLEIIVRRPKLDKRETVVNGILDVEQGLIGDNWLTRGSSRTDNGLGHPEMQLNLMNIRFAELIAGSRERVPLAGDQLFVDLDLSGDNLPPGTRLAIGDAVIEVTAVPHLGCKKFVSRFGIDAMRFANSDFGRKHNLRGINAKIVRGGIISVGDQISRWNADSKA